MIDALRESVMISVMADKTEVDAESRKRVLRTHRWDPDVLDACADYMAAQEVPPTEIAVLEKAAKEFFEKRGFLPRKKAKARKANGD